MTHTLRQSIQALSCAALVFATPVASQSPGVAITDVTVIDVADGSLHPGQTVVIEGHRITAMGGAVRVPVGATVISGAGGYLIPGLWDMHVHTFNNNAPQPPNTWTFPLYLANGVTGVRDMWVRPGAQAEQVHAWRRGLDAGTFVGPRFGSIGTLVDGTPPVQPGADVLASRDSVRGYVARLKASGIDFVKVYSRLSPEVYDAIVEAARDAGMYVAGHGPRAISSFDVAASGQRSIEHLTGVHETCSSRGDSLRAANVGVYSDPAAFVSHFAPATCAALYTQFATDSTWQVPTLITNRIWDSVATLAGLRRDEGHLYIPLGEAAEWDWVADFLAYTPPAGRVAFASLYAFERRIVGEMHHAGVPFLAGTDFGNPYVYPGFSLIDEIGEFVAAGLSPLAALQTATRNPARYLGREADLGSVDVGKLADLVLLDANPLEDVGNLRQVRAVVVNGRAFQRPALDSMKQAVLAANYREAIARPAPLGVQVLDPEALARFAGKYVAEEGTSEATVSATAEGLRVAFRRFADPLEPLGGLLFRVVDQSVLYTFLTDQDGAVWGFELNDGDEVVRYRLTRP